MFKDVSAIAAFNEQTGYGIHATNLFRELNTLIPVKQNNMDGDAIICLLDSVSACNVNLSTTKPAILYNVWESTEQTPQFMEKLKSYQQFWVASEWQRQCSIKQGLDPDFVKVVPEGIDPHICKPIEQEEKDTFDFLIVGKWEDRKYSREMVQAWLETFPAEEDYSDLRLYVSADNPFPVDQYKTTEERLKAYGLEDSRIIPLRHEPHDATIARMQKANVYLSCARAEGWNLPLIEAMACGIPSIALNYSGSTEYAKDAMLVKVCNMIKPFNVYGMSDCPGEWAEPDYEDLKQVMRDAFHDYSQHKQKALETSSYIRKEFTWKKAAQKAYGLLADFYEKQKICLDVTPGTPKIAEVDEMKAFFYKEASKNGYEIVTLQVRKRQDIFVIGCWPNSNERMDTLVETIKQVKALGYPVLISSHYPLPAPIIEQADYYIYDKKNILSGDFKPVYTRRNQQGEKEQKEANVEYHAVACLNAMRNAIDFCKGKFNRIHYLEFDVEVDLNEYLGKVAAAETALVFIGYENTGIRTDIYSGTVDALDKNIPYIHSWKEYESKIKDGRYILESWLSDYIFPRVDPHSISYIKCGVHNRFDQVDRECWKDDVFSHHFIDGPFLNIAGISNRVYDVTFKNPQDGIQYRTQQKCGTWTRPATKVYRDWEITAKINEEIKYHAKMDLAGKRVLISLGSKALGDTLAWVPYIEEFRKKHNCHVITATWWNHIFDYPEIEFIGVGTRVENLYASYEIGCFDGDRHKNPADWRTVPLQKVASDILGLEYQEVRPKLKTPLTLTRPAEPYFCFSEVSTMRPKLWNRDGAWQKVIDYLQKKYGLAAVSISKEESKLNNVLKYNDRTIEQTIATLQNCEFYIGLGHGPSWLAWACGVPVILISGFSETWAEFPTPYRVINKDVCHGCFNDTTVKFERGWEWCPHNKGYECTREITPAMVIKEAQTIICGGKE